MAVVDLHNSSDSSFEDQPMKEVKFSSPPSTLSHDYSTASCSAESDSDQGAADDYIAELTRQMAHYMLNDFDDPNIPPVEEEKQGNSEVEEEIRPISEFQMKQALIDEQIRSVQLNKLKQERELKKQQQELAKQSNGNNRKGKKNRFKNRAPVNGSPPVNDNNNNNNNIEVQNATWQLRSNFRSGGCPEMMTAVFLGDSGRAGTTGTGVFLPRGGVGNTTTSSPESRKKPGCSTVLIPARVVHALKQHFDTLGSVPASPLIPPPAAASLPPLQHVTGDWRYAFQLQQKSQAPAKAAHDRDHRHHNHHYQEMGLPQEWTY